jgi:hypothetical protein
LIGDEEAGDRVRSYAQAFLTVIQAASYLLKPRKYVFSIAALMSDVPVLQEEK